ncbi:MFS transporter [Virgibacillus siamensis]|uniref:MFS transporter n=1 Tax=Virgibacillus siamensis TaxID=480071 RepID=UPI00158A426B|nr:MFS transporter [Virgibacillus siamensis]
MKNTIKKPWLLVFTISLGTLLNPLNSSMISVALTRLQHVLDLSFASATWLISIFYLVSAVGQPVMGKLGDMFGQKKLFLTGLVLVAMSSALAPLIANFGWLLGCRALQALGSSSLFPSGMSMVRNYITTGQARALSVLAVFSSVSAAFGPTIGGFLIEGFDWEAIFLVNLPFIVVSFLMALFILPKQSGGKLTLGRIDFGGIGLFTVFIVFLILFLLSLKGEIRYWTMPIFIAATVLFYFYEKRQTEPFIDLSALKSNKNVLLVYAQFISINLVYYCYFYGLPTFLQQVRHYSGGTTGLIMLAMAGFGVIVAPLAGRWIDLHGSKPAVLSGAIALTAGTALLLTVHETTPLLGLLGVMSVIGISNGFNNIGMQTSLFRFADPEKTGAASGLFQTSRYLGAILSTALLGIFFNDTIDVAHFHIVAAISLVFCAFTLFLSIRMPRDTAVQN